MSATGLGTKPCLTLLLGNLNIFIRNMAVQDDCGVVKRKIAAILANVELNDENTGTSKERKTRGWICKREENGLCNNLVMELSIEHTTGFLFHFLADSTLFVTSSYL